VEDCFGEFCFFGVHKADHYCEGLEGGQALISGSGGVFAFSFKVIQEGQDEIDGQMIELDRVDFDGKVLGGKGQKEREGIPVGLGGVLPTAFYAGQIVMEELEDTA
jgi:hypothetical protein